MLKMGKKTDRSIAEAVEEVEKAFPLEKDRDNEFYRFYMKMALQPCPYYDLRTSSLFEVFNITIYTTKSKVEVYGTITVDDANRHRMELYSRTESNAETLDSGEKLSLTGEHCGAIALPSFLTVTVDLKDKSNGGCVFASGSFSLNYDKLDDYDVVKTEVIRGTYGEVNIQCATLGQAVFATFSITCNNHDVQGCLSARYEDNYTFSEPPPSIVLSKMQGLQGVFPSRSALAVPVYSPLILDFQLCLPTRDPSDHVLKLYPRNGGRNYEVIDVDGCRVEVVVTWSNAFELSVQLEYPDLQTSFKRRSIKPSVMLQFLSSLSLTDPLGSLLSSVGNEPRRFLVEVYSIYVRSDEHKVVSIWGSIVFQKYDTWLEFNLFKSDEKEQVLCDAHGRIKPELLNWPSCSFTTSPVNFRLELDLKDDKGCEICRGYLDYDEDSVGDRTTGISKRFCSFVPGDYGYAAVHLTMLPEAVEGHLKLSLLCHDKFTDNRPQVFGRIVAYYDNDFTGKRVISSYEQNYYRIMLFDAALAENYVELDQNLAIPLSRRVLCVPTDCYLIVEVQLWVSLPSVEDRIYLCGGAVFKYDDNDGCLSSAKLNSDGEEKKCGVKVSLKLKSYEKTRGINLWLKSSDEDECVDEEERCEVIGKSAVSVPPSRKRSLSPSRDDDKNQEDEEAEGSSDMLVG